MRSDVEATIVWYVVSVPHEQILRLPAPWQLCVCAQSLIRDGAMPHYHDIFCSTLPPTISRVEPAGITIIVALRRAPS